MQNSRCGQSGRCRRGQNITEYLILVAGVLVVVILATSKGGFFTRGVDKSINMMFDSVEDMATVQCLGTIDDVNGQWNSWGAWAGCGWDAVSSSCLEYSTHTCNNPSPKCGGTECKLELAAGSTTPLNRTESKSQACYVGSWQVGVCPPGGCTGSCGSTIGTCAVAVTCPADSCCDPADKPATTIACTKPAYPDVWSGLGFGACSVSCDAGISSQTVTCSGMCCDAGLKPPTRRACTDGCCTDNLYIGRDIENDVDFTADFTGPKPNGQPYTATCPAGYAGTPTRTCAATADSAGCTGNDSYVPPAGCYNIGWGALSGECQPANCDPETADVGFGDYTLDYEFPFTLHGDTAYIDCATLTQPNGARHTGGNASYDCWLGKWENLNAACIPNCSEQTLDVGAGQTGLFPETEDGKPGTSSCPCGYQGSPQRRCDEVGNNIGEWGNLIAGTECAIKRCGEPGGEKFPVLVLTDDSGNPVETVEGTFGPVDHLESSDLDCQTQIDSRLEGTASMDCDWCANTLNGWINPDYQCIPRHCEPVTDNSVDMGSGVKGNLPLGDHNDEQTLSCADYDPLFTGESKYKCVYGEWTPLSLGCGAKDCVDWTTNIGGTVSGTFTGGAGSHGATRDLTCDTINSYYQGTASSTCCYGDWYAGGTICASITTPSGTNVYSPDPACAANQCTGTEPSGDMSMCSGDGTDLTATDVADWSVVEYDNCTARKCEYQCSQYYYKSGNACYLAICDGSAPGSASGCSGDESNLTASQNGTLRHLVSDCAEGAACDASRCTDGDKCEYYCPSGAVVYNGGCCNPDECGNISSDLCPGGSSSYSDNCGGTINCKSCSCTLDDVTVSNGGNRLFYNSTSVSCGNSCSSQLRSCTNGNLSGDSSYQYASCTVDTCADCTSPCDGSTITHGNQETCWSASSVACGGNCDSVKATATCNNGSWNPSSFTSYTSASCTVQTTCNGNGTCDTACENCSNCPADCGGAGVWSVNSYTAITCPQPSPDLTGESCCPLNSTASGSFLTGPVPVCYSATYQCETGLNWAEFPKQCLSPLFDRFACDNDSPLGQSCSTAGSVCFVNTRDYCGGMIPRWWYKRFRCQ